MNVKGIAYLARQAMVVEEFGEARWRAFLAEWRRGHPEFPVTVLPVSKLPAGPFIQMQEALVRELYGGDPLAFWHIGLKSAQHAMSRGQLKGLFKPEEVRRFVLFTPHIYRGYFDGGELTATPRGDEVVEIAITGTPAHIYFEYSILGFLQGGLQALDPKAEPPRRVKGFSAGDDTIVYRVRA